MCVRTWVFLACVCSLHSRFKNKMKCILTRKWMGIAYLEKIDKVIYFFLVLSILLYASIGNWPFKTQCVVGEYCALFQFVWHWLNCRSVERAFLCRPIRFGRFVCELNVNFNFKLSAHWIYAIPSKNQQKKRLKKRYGRDCSCNKYLCVYFSLHL